MGMAFNAARGQGHQCSPRDLLRGAEAVIPWQWAIALALGSGLHPLWSSLALAPVIRRIFANSRCVERAA